MEGDAVAKNSKIRSRVAGGVVVAIGHGCNEREEEAGSRRRGATRLFGYSEWIEQWRGMTLLFSDLVFVNHLDIEQRGLFLAYIAIARERRGKKWGKERKKRREEKRKKPHLLLHRF